VRRALNDNPVIQIAVLGVMGVVVAFFLITRVAHKDEPAAEPPASTAATESPATSAPVGADASTTPAPATGTAPPATTPPATTPPEGVPSVPEPGTTVPPSGSIGGAPVGEFVAGPGLPAPVVKAYADGKVVVVLVVRHHGFDDHAVRRAVEGLRHRKDLAVFVTAAGQIAHYARIAEGVDVNRVPALIVLRPRRLAEGVPTATVSYGFRSPESVAQAIRDALYKGPTNLPYHPK